MMVTITKDRQLCFIFYALLGAGFLIIGESPILGQLKKASAEAKAAGFPVKGLILCCRRFVQKQKWFGISQG